MNPDELMDILDKNRTTDAGVDMVNGRFVIKLKEKVLACDLQDMYLVGIVDE